MAIFIPFASACVLLRMCFPESILNGGNLFTSLTEAKSSNGKDSNETCWLSKWIEKIFERRFCLIEEYYKKSLKKFNNYCYITIN